MTKPNVHSIPFHQPARKIQLTNNEFIDCPPYDSVANIYDIGIAFSSCIIVEFCEGEQIHSLYLTGGHYLSVAYVRAEADSAIITESLDYLKDESEAQTLYKKFLDNLPEVIASFLNEKYSLLV
jgi:hypothetical protein